MSGRAIAATGPTRTRDGRTIVLPRGRSTPELAALALTAIATLLLAGSLAVATLRLDGYGLVGSLPISYHAGIAVLPLAAMLAWTRPRGAPVLIAGLVVFVVFVWLTPLALEGTPRFRTGYLSYGYVDPIVRGEGLRPAEFFYHNWPLFPLLFGGLVTLTGLDPLTLLGWFPTAIVLLYLVPLGGLLRLVTVPIRERVPGAWALGLWLFVAFDWTGQDYFSPQALAFLVFLCWAWLLAWVALRREGRFERPATAVALVLFGLLVLTHVLTSLLALGALTTLTIAGFLRRPSLLVTCVVLFLGWQAYVAAPFFASYGPHLLRALLAVQDFFLVNLSNRIGGSAEHEVIATLRVAVSLVAFGLGALGVARFLAARGSRTGVAPTRSNEPGLGRLADRFGARPWRRFPEETRFALVFLAGIAVVAPISLYGGEMLIRILLFSLPMLAVLLVRAADAPVVRLITLAALLVAAPLHVVTHYGNELYDHVSKGELTGFAVVADTLAPANVYGAYPAADFRRTTELDSRTSVPAGANYPLDPTPLDGPDTALRWLDRDLPIYVAFSRGDAAAAELFFDDRSYVERALERLDRDPAYRLVYRNPDIAIYEWLGNARAREEEH